MTKVKIYVIRQLESIPVLTGVVETDKDEHDDVEQYLNSRADEIINSFSKKFPEFTNAKWFKQYVNSSSVFTELT